MRVSRAQAAESRQRILETASRLFREKGVGATGVDALMTAAGMTHGGFYTHFASKEKLVAEACRAAAARSLERWASFAQQEDPLAAIVAHYLSAAHRDDPGGGCFVAALGPEAARGGLEFRDAFTSGVKSLLETLERVAPQGDASRNREQALAALSTLVGAMVLARASSSSDPALSDEFLAAASKALLSEERPS